MASAKGAYIQITQLVATMVNRKAIAMIQAMNNLTGFMRVVELPRMKPKNSSGIIKLFYTVILKVKVLFYQYR